MFVGQAYDGVAETPAWTSTIVLGKKFSTAISRHTRETREDPQNRKEWKFHIVRGLYERGLAGEELQ